MLFCGFLVVFGGFGGERGEGEEKRRKGGRKRERRREEEGKEVFKKKKRGPPGLLYFGQRASELKIKGSTWAAEANNDICRNTPKQYSKIQPK